MGAKRLGYGGETTRVENRGETTRGETTRGEMSWGRNVLLPPPRPKGNSQTTYMPTDIFFYINILFVAGLEPVWKRYVAQ